MKKNIKDIWAIVCVFILAAALNGCCAYNHKNYPMESWFVKPTAMIDAAQFKQIAEPLCVLLYVTYKQDGRSVITDPFADRTPDWREQDGLWLASKRYLEETGMFQIVGIEDENIQGRVMINLTRDMDEKTKALIAAKEASGNDDNIVYEYNMAMDMAVVMKGKDALKAEALTNHMYIGHEDSKEKALGQDAEKFTFSYFDNMEFHTEFVRRFYKQMLYECLKQIENNL